MTVEQTAYTENVIAALASHDRDDTTAYYVQAFTIARDGQAVAGWRWQNDGYIETSLLALAEELDAERPLDLDDPPEWLHVDGTYVGPSGWSHLSWPRVGRVAALLVLVITLAAGTAGIGYLAGMHRGDRLVREELRTRRAVCQVLDQYGADASTAEQAEPCRDTPARP